MPLEVGVGGGPAHSSFLPQRRKGCRHPIIACGSKMDFLSTSLPINTRTIFRSSGLGFSAEDRRENVRRVAEVARLMVDLGIIVIVPVIR